MNPDDNDKHPGKDIRWETAKTGDNLSGDWKKVTDAMDGIAGEKHKIYSYSGRFDRLNCQKDA